MQDTFQTGAIRPFSVVKYVTKDGELCSATKENNVVTVVGDKNGVRQMSVKNFLNELALNLPKTNLEKSPSEDTVSISGKEKTL